MSDAKFKPGATWYRIETADKTVVVSGTIVSVLSQEYFNKVDRQYRVSTGGTFNEDALLTKEELLARLDSIIAELKELKAQYDV